MFKEIMKTIIFDFDGVIHGTFELAYKINVSIFGESHTREKHKGTVVGSGTFSCDNLVACLFFSCI